MEWAVAAENVHVWVVALPPISPALIPTSALALGATLPG